MCVCVDDDKEEEEEIRVKLDEDVFYLFFLSFAGVLFLSVFSVFLS